MPTLSPAEQDNSQSYRDYLEAFCDNLEIKCEWPEQGLALLHLTDEAATLLEGRRISGYTCKLALSVEAAGEHSDAALFVPGSYHWDRILEVVLDKAKACRQYVVGIPSFIESEDIDLEPDGGRMIYEPHLLAQWRLSYRADDITKHRILDLTINLVSGDLYHGYYYSLLPCVLHTEPLPHIPQAKMNIRYKRAYRYMTEEIQYVLANEDGSWALPANARLSSELLDLEEYYKERALHETTSSQLDAEHRKAIHELKERLAPKVMAGPFATALIYIPIIAYEMEIDGEVLGLRFDPVTGHALG